MLWINVAVMMVMITSGWGIYDDGEIIHGLHFAGFIRLCDWAACSPELAYGGHVALRQQWTYLARMRTAHGTVRRTTIADQAKKSGAGGAV